VKLDPAMRGRRVTGKDINVIHLTVPRDRRHTIQLFYAVSGRGQRTINVAAGSLGGKLIVKLCDMIARRHNEDYS